MEQFRDSLGITPGTEWDKWCGLGENAAQALQAFVKDSPIAHHRRESAAPTVPVPAIPAPTGAEQSTQAAFGKIMHELAKGGEELADRIVTTAPDVTQTTNLGAFVNQRGLFRRQELGDVFLKAKIPSTQKWLQHTAGQHI
jgi:pyruvate dehydrogenase E1 component